MPRPHNEVRPKEILLHNLVDKEFQNLFQPLYYLSIVFCLRKFDFYDNFVTPITRRDFVSCILAMSLIYLLLFFTLKYFATIFDTPIVFAMYFITYVQYAINYTILSLLNVFEGKINVDVLLILYNINKSLGNSNDNKKIMYVTWITISALFFAYFCLVFLKLLLDPLWNWSRAMFIATTLIFDLELLYIVFIAYFLACKTETWRRLLNAKRLNFEDQIQEGNELRDMFLMFENILKALELTKKASRWVILFHFVIAFTQALTYIEIQILWTKSNAVDPVVVSSHLFGVVLWVFKSLTMETILCVSCELLYQNISAAKVEVILYFADRPSCSVRRFKRNFFRLIMARFQKLSPLGIFSVDAGLPLRMGAFLANYIIVLIHFAF